jgi:hypothetical protein
VSSVTAIIGGVVRMCLIVIYGGQSGCFYSVFLFGSGGAAGAERGTSLEGSSALLLRLLVSDMAVLCSRRRAASWEVILALAL